MKLKTIFFCLISFAFSQLVYAQLDSIEYNLWEQIHDFKIKKNTYIFKTWDGAIIEKDTLLFDVNLFFSNYPANYTPDYVDSVQFVIASRTLKKSYGERILHTKQNSYIRICWLKETFPIIIKFEELNNERINFFLKVGSGNYERHGHLVYDTTFHLSARKSKKIKKLIKSESYFNLVNGVTCSNGIHLPNVFFFEFSDGEGRNMIVINECNLSSSDYEHVFKLYVIAKAIIKKQKLFPEYFLD
ncbi:MAG: hypothetical protein RBR87_06520 [Bacteroidales bacterium]|jgi:hypothetical protein|nr:hypothetical protein [Bacteroidales bacterium]